MSLIAMAVYDTEENGRTKYTLRTLMSLLQTVDWEVNRLIVVDNNSCKQTKDILRGNVVPNMNVIYLRNNLGTASAINEAWVNRIDGEHCIKIDNDILVNQRGWVEELEFVAERGLAHRPIGQVGLKRKDCIECVTEKNPFYKSKLHQLVHQPGERWVVVEEQFHIMGSCVLHTSQLLDKIGYMYQLGVYGFDDSFMSARAIKAGFATVMLPHIDIDHIDAGDNPYQKEKEKLANDVFISGKYHATLNRINEGNYYYNPFDHAAPNSIV
jgi:GT2 family glycosyltransferase